VALGDRIRRNIAHVDPTERALLRDAFLELNRRTFGGSRNDAVPGGVTWWFKQDEIHQATHVHQGPEFIPWHRVIVNRLEAMLREINPQLTLHYWDWTQDPRSITNANLGTGTPGLLSLFTPEFMGWGGANSQAIGKPWSDAQYYVPGADPHRDKSPPATPAGGTAADPPREVRRSVNGTPATAAQDAGILAASDYADMRDRLEIVHDRMHGFVAMGGRHISFRDPFVFLLHSNVDRLFARWQTDPAHPERLEGATVYGTESNLDVQVNGHTQNVNHNIEPWSTGQGEVNNIRPWFAPEKLGDPHTYKHPSVVAPPSYDTNHAYLDWSGNFTGAGKSEVLIHYDDGSWQLGSVTGNQVGLPTVGNTSGFGNLADGAHPSWTGNFTGSGNTEILFNYVGDGNWWLGTVTAAAITFTKVGNTSGFGNLADGAHPSWTGDFTGSGKTEILFNYIGDGNWWLGTITGNQLTWSNVGNTVGFGNLADGAHPSWIGDFIGSGRAQILFNYVGDGNWWLGTITANQLTWSNVGNTVGFGNLADGAHPSWIGDFIGSGQAQILFNYVGDGNWWLGTVAGAALSFANVGNTKGFGNLADGAHPSWTGDFIAAGKLQILFNYVGDGNWWLGTFAGSVLGWTKVANTVGFGDLADGAHPSWTGPFTGSGQSELLFNYVWDGNWWLGRFAGGQLTWGFAGKTARRGGLLHPVRR
jgi:hypothetical protein